LTDLVTPSQGDKRFVQKNFHSWCLAISVNQVVKMG